MKKVALVIVVLVLAGIGVSRFFGATVEHKFQNANAAVQMDSTAWGAETYRPSVVARPAFRRAEVFRTTAEPVVEPEQTDTLQGRVSTFAIDVDTGSYTLARRMLAANQMPDAYSVRPEEFLNYFHYQYGLPPAGRTAAVHFEGAPSPLAEGGNNYLLRIGLQAADVATPTPVHLTFLVDTSGSMRGDDRIEAAKLAILTAAATLRPTDSVAIVTYSGSVSKVLDPTSPSKRQTIERAVGSLTASGGTAMGEAMEFAYRMAVQNARPGSVSRIVVLSDGDANIGETDPATILARVRSWIADGVTLSTVGFGTGNYRDTMMEELADAGDGNYTYIDSSREVAKVFGDDLFSLVHVVARDVKVQVEFDPEYVKSWRLVGYENRKMAEQDFRNDAADAGELGARHQVTALYEVTLHDAAPQADSLGEVRFRYKAVGQSRATEATMHFTGAHLRQRVADASADFRFQAAVAAFAEKLRGERSQSWGWIEEVAASATEGRKEREQLVELIRIAHAIDQRG